MAIGAVLACGPPLRRILHPDRAFPEPAERSREPRCGGRSPVPEIADGLRARTDPDQPRVKDGLREIGVLKESVARVDRVGTGLSPRRPESGEVEGHDSAEFDHQRERLVGQPHVRNVGIRLGVPPRSPASFAARIARTDLAAVGDETFEMLWPA